MPNLDEFAPDFASDTDKGRISLSDFRGKWLVLFAYPADFTPICEMDILGFAKNQAAFDRLGVRFVGWSVDTAESHQRWIKELDERTGVDIRYPLIADVDKMLAEKYGILHKTKGVTYRAVFVVDPDGILKFSAVYPLDVGRSVKEVERIIKVLQRARELRHLDESSRERELGVYNSVVYEFEQQEVIEQAKRIVHEAEKNGVTLRLLGGLAIRLHCHGKHSMHLRDYRDIDLFGLSRERADMESVLEKLGYAPNLKFNTLYGETRLQFITDRSEKIDIFLDKFHMQHTLDLSQRILLDDVTIPVTDLLLTKLQMEGRIEEKDAIDLVAILEDHDIGYSDERETIDLDYISDLCSRNWGLYRTVTGNLHNIERLIEDGVLIQCVGMEANELLSKVEAIGDALTSSKKRLGWRVRSMIGERKRWYQKVSEG